jgi:hypothetical protein
MKDASPHPQPLSPSPSPADAGEGSGVSRKRDHSYGGAHNAIPPTIFPIEGRAGCDI